MFRIAMTLQVIFLLAVLTTSNAAAVPPKSERLLIKSTARQISEDACSFSDLEGLGSSPAAVRSKFAELYGKTPDGIAVNSEGYYAAVSPPITEQYGYSCSKIVGQPSFKQIGSEIEQLLLLEKTVYNFGDQELDTTVGLERTWVDSTEASISFTTGFSFSFTAGVEGVASSGHEFSFSVTNGRTEKSESRDRITSTDMVTIPAKSKVYITAYATIQKETLEYSMPLSVSGYFGANFPDRVRPVDGSSDDNAYFWFRSVSSILPSTQGTASGVITDAHSIDFQTHAGQPAPLTPEEIAQGPSLG